MYRTRMPATRKTVLHRDGTVTIWDCLQQAWVRGSDPSNELLATLSEPERSRIVQATTRL